MRKKAAITTLGALSMLSIGLCVAVLPKNISMAKAATSIDLSLNFRTSGSKAGFYMNASENALPVKEWDMRYYPTSEDCIKIDGAAVAKIGYNWEGSLVKTSATDYYMAFGDYDSYVNEGSVVTFGGEWSYTYDEEQYDISMEAFSVKWNGSAWVEFFDPESLDLEPYEILSLAQCGLDDYHGEGTWNSEDYPIPGVSPYNSYALTEGNAKNSFSFAFEMATYETSSTGLTIRFGSSASWVTGHYFQISANNTWGPTGVIVFQEFEEGEQIGTKSQDVNADMISGDKHLYEVGHIAIKNSDEYVNYIKVDGDVRWHNVAEEASSTKRLPRVGVYCGDNAYIGNVYDQKDDEVLYLNPSMADSDPTRGIYLINDDVNDMPFDSSDWSIRAYNATKNNLLLNGKPAVSDRTSRTLCKFGEHDYYVSLGDAGIRVSQDDIITVRDEFRTAYEGAITTMGIKEMHLLYDGTRWNELPNLPSYLANKLSESYDPDLYDDDKVTLIEQIISKALSDMNDLSRSDGMWGIYEKALSDISEVPLNEEKAQEKLREAKDAAVTTVNNYVSLDDYTSENQTKVTSLIEKALGDIETATSISEVLSIVDSFKANVDKIETLLSVMERAILDHDDGYEQYLSVYDVATTTDLSYTGDMMFYAFDSDKQSYYNPADPADSLITNIPESKNNTTGSMVFQFKYSSSDPSSNKYGSQIFTRLRGTLSTNYRFAIPTGAGLNICRFIDDRAYDSIDYPYYFEANTEYNVQFGAINVSTYDRVYQYISVNGVKVVEQIVDKIPGTDKARIMICDSYLGDGSAEWAKMSPLEEGASKIDASSNVGGMIVDNSRNDGVLRTTMRANSIPLEASLYPTSENAITVDGKPLTNGYHAMITKTSERGYVVELSANGITASNGTEVVIDGYFAYYDETAKTKIAVKIAKSSFTYSSASSSWIQGELDLDTVKQNAVDYLNSYVDLNDYSEENAATVQKIISAATSEINSASSASMVESALNSALERINAVKTILGEYKEAAKAELASYKNLEDYREKEQKQINTTLESAYASIDAANNKASIDTIVSSIKASLDSIKTKAQYEAEELATAKTRARNEVEIYFGLVDIDRYSDENVAVLGKLVTDVREAINEASTISEIESLVAKFKEDVKAVKTKDGSTFNGETYEEGSKGGNNKGCGGAIASSAIMVGISAIGVALLAVKRNKNDK